MTTDAEAFFFLHDLITSYVKEKERVLSIQQKTLESYQTSHAEKTSYWTGKGASGDAQSTSTGGAESKRATASAGDKKHNIDPLHNDWRRFKCDTWHLEPTVRLISTFGSQIEPYGVDLILSKLGFSQARITIPKWLQRGCMDPLDKIMSTIVLQVIQSVKEEPKQSANQQQEQSHEIVGNSSTSLRGNSTVIYPSPMSSYYSPTSYAMSSKTNEQSKHKSYR